MKILYLILHTKKHQDRYDNVVNTWAKNVDFLFYSDHDDDNKQIIKVTDRNDYHSNEVKFYSVVKNFPEKYLNYDWYFFCDNDTFVNTKLFEDNLNKFNSSKVYGQKIYTWTQDPTLGYYSGGAGYLISNRILRFLKTNIKNYNTGFSDVTLGLNIKEHEIENEDSDFFKSQPPEYYNIKIEDTKNYISFHYIKTFNKMNELLNNI